MKLLTTSKFESDKLIKNTKYIRNLVWDYYYYFYKKFRGFNDLIDIDLDLK